MTWNSGLAVLLHRALLGLEIPIRAGPSAGAGQMGWRGDPEAQGTPSRRRPLPSSFLRRDSGSGDSRPSGAWGFQDNQSSVSLGPCMTGSSMGCGESSAQTLLPCSGPACCQRAVGQRPQRPKPAVGTQGPPLVITLGPRPLPPGISGVRAARRLRSPSREPWGDPAGPDSKLGAALSCPAGSPLCQLFERRRLTVLHVLQKLGNTCETACTIS